MHISFMTFGQCKPEIWQENFKQEAQVSLNRSPALNTLDLRYMLNPINQAITPNKDSQT